MKEERSQFAQRVLRRVKAYERRRYRGRIVLGCGLAAGIAAFLLFQVDRAERNAGIPAPGADASAEATRVALLDMVLASSGMDAVRGSPESAAPGWMQPLRDPALQPFLTRAIVDRVQLYAAEPTSTRFSDILIAIHDAPPAAQTAACGIVLHGFTVDDATVRSHAIEVLAKVVPADYTHPILEGCFANRLETTDLIELRSAIEFIAGHRRTNLDRNVLRILEDADPERRRLAARKSVDLDPELARRALQAHGDDPVPAVEYSVLDARIRLGERELLERLPAVAEKGDDEVRADVLQTLRDFDPKAAVAVARPAIRPEASLRLLMQACEALGEAKAPLPDTAGPWLYEKGELMEIRAAYAAAASGSADGERRLIRYLEREPCPRKWDALRFAARLENPALVAAVKALRESPDIAIRTTTRETLARSPGGTRDKEE